MLPTGVNFETYASEARIFTTTRSRVGILSLIGVLLVVPLLSGPYILGVAAQASISLIAVLGLHVTVGMAGQINVAQSAFVGVGAFLTAKLAGYGLPVWIVIPLVALATGLVGVVFALPAARVKGFYLALTTLAAQVLFPIVILGLPSGWLGGLVGMPIESLVIAGYTLASPRAFYYFTLILALVMTCAAFNLHRSGFGRALKAVRDNDTTAEVMGIDVLRTKIYAFFVGSMFAGVAGACTAWFLQFVTVESFTLFASIWYLGMLIVGGIQSPIGSILGVLFVTAFQEGLYELGGTIMRSNAPEAGGFIFAATNVLLGVALLLVLIFEPRGLAHRWSVLQNNLQLWPFPHR